MSLGIWSLKTKSKAKSTLQSVWTPAGERKEAWWQFWVTWMCLFCSTWCVKEAGEVRKGSPADPFQGAGHLPAGRDQYKLMANQLRERHQSLKKYRELMRTYYVMVMSPFPCGDRKGALSMRSLLKGWIQTVSKWKDMKVFHVIRTWKSSTPLPPHPVPFAGY